MNNDRYTTPVMAEIWSDETRYRMMVEVWSCILLGQSVHYDQSKFDLSLTTTADGLKEALSSWEMTGLDRLVSEVRRLEENEHGHEVEALRHLFSSELIDQAAAGQEYGNDLVHLDLTSSDVTDLVDSVRIALSVRDLRTHLRFVIKTLQRLVEMTQDWPSVGYTHMQVGEPITHGYRLAGHLVEFWQISCDLAAFPLQVKLARGAMGSAHMTRRFLAPGSKQEHLEEAILDVINHRFMSVSSRLVPSPHSTQTPPRHNEYNLLTILDRLAAANHRLALTARFLFSTGEWLNESGDVGSSAMPHKNNPAKWEQVCSLAQTVHSLCSGAWSTTANQIDMRTLDDSAQRRIVWGDVFSLLAHSLGTVHQSLGRISFRRDASIFDDSRVWSSTILSYHLRVYTTPRTEAHEQIAQAIRANPRTEDLMEVVRGWHGMSEHVEEIFDQGRIIQACVDGCKRVLVRIEGS